MQLAKYLLTRAFGTPSKWTPPLIIVAVLSSVIAGQSIYIVFGDDGVAVCTETQTESDAAKVDKEAYRSLLRKFNQS